MWMSCTQVMPVKLIQKLCSKKIRRKITAGEGNIEISYHASPH